MRGLSVSCSTCTGVPLSTQWGSQGYFYPIQIAQYGLSHYSKHLLDTSRTTQLLDDAETNSRPSPHWHHAGGSSLRVIRDSERGSNVLEFNTAGWCYELYKLSKSNLFSTVCVCEAVNMLFLR
jgi:hypothetical protein